MIYGFRRMIYLLRKHDIISVPTHAKRISSAEQISYRQVYHPFRKERISLKKARLCVLFSWCEKRDLNPYGVNHTPLKRVRLPVPPLSHCLRSCACV